MKVKPSVTDKQWNKWGESNPYFGVLGWESSKITSDQSLLKFFETGRTHISSVLEIARTRLSGNVSQTRAIDFGCGVGRLLVPLAETFEEVIGVDISPAMLDLARQNTANYPNVSFAHHLDEIQGQVRPSA